MTDLTQQAGCDISKVMSDGAPSFPPESKRAREAWRIERLVQRAPPHIHENGPNAVFLSLAAAGLIGIILIAANLAWPHGIAPQGSQGNVPLSEITPTPAAPPRSTSTRAPTGATAQTTPTRLVPTPTATHAPTAAKSPSPGVRHYTVQHGDTLLAVAIRFKVTVEAIRAANGMKDDTIRVGDELIIPLPTPSH